jgi:hypothetical protein
VTGSIEVLVATLPRTADAVPVSPVPWTSAQHIAVDVAERH